VRENLTEAYKGEDKKRQSSDARQLSKMTLSQILNLSINQTMSRTILTTMTTLLVVLALWLLGGGAVKDLAFALVIGLIAGTYSTVFIACPVVMLFEPKKVRNERVAA
jgi:preprotein translocase subunit SecF